MRFRKESPVEVRGFLDDGTEIIGDLKFSDVLHLHGHIKGRVISEGELVVGEKGIIEGDVEVGILTIGGTLIGNIIAKKKVHILNTARIRGDVATPILRVDEGAMWEGSITTTLQEKSPGHFVHAAGEVEATH